LIESENGETTPVFTGVFYISPASREARTGDTGIADFFMLIIEVYLLFVI
jgi:hypothetical protein